MTSFGTHAHRQHLATGECHQPVGGREHGADHVLDPDHGRARVADAAPASSMNSPTLALGEAGGDLVDEQQLRPHRQRPAPARGALRTSSGRRPASVSAEARQAGCGERALDPLRGLGTREAAGEGGGDAQVVEHRHLPERPRHLVRAGDAAAGAVVRGQGGDVLAAEGDASCRRLDVTREHAEQRRLAGTVGPDHAQDLALGDGEAHVVRDADRNRTTC